MMIDTHAHIDMDCYKDNFDKYYNEIINSEVEKVIIPGVIPKDFPRIINLCENYSNLYAGIGVHPSELRDVEDNYIDIIKKYLNHYKVVAIGEIGLDYYWDKEPEIIEHQKEVFRTQIELAKEYNLPILVHDREAHFDTYSIIKDCLKDKKIPVIMHCFSGSKEFMEQCLKEDWYIALGGVVTFKNAKKIKEVAKYVPIEKLLLETDSPYLTPVPYRGEQNSPAYLKYIAKEIAQIRETDVEIIMSKTTENAKNIFKFKD